MKKDKDDLKSNLVQLRISNNDLKLVKEILVYKNRGNVSEYVRELILNDIRETKIRIGKAQGLGNTNSAPRPLPRVNNIQQNKTENNHRSYDVRKRRK
jgi:hypothetical protein